MMTDSEEEEQQAAQEERDTRNAGKFDYGVRQTVTTQARIGQQHFASRGAQLSAYEHVGIDSWVSFVVED